MKHIPILFSTLMVQANLDGSKSMTRRTKGLEVINENPDDWQFEWADFALKLPYRFTKKSTVNEKSLADQSFHQEAIKCPYGKPGDILWVRETINIGQNGRFHYKSDELGPLSEVKWKPSIHMPKEACRLFLKVTNVRVERLQDISEEDAVAEGIQQTFRGMFNAYKNYINDGKGSYQPVGSFKSLWQSINGKDSWEANPWVWVIEFEQTEKPENFLS